MRGEERLEKQGEGMGKGRKQLCYKNKVGNQIIKR